MIGISTDGPVQKHSAICFLQTMAVCEKRDLSECAGDCRTVKNYVYDRYSGIHSLPKLCPGYTIQNEMTKSGLRKSLGLPSLYFYLSVFDALGDIKS